MTTHPLVTIQLVHPHPVEREAIASWLSRQSYLSFKGKCSSLEEVTGSKCLSDLDMIIAFAYNSDHTAYQVQHLKKTHPSLKILLATDTAGIATLRDIVHSGVDGLIDVNAEIEEWEWAIRSVAKGKVYYGQQIMRHLAEVAHAPETGEPASASHSLSKRELEILRLVASEYSTNRIADQLFISGKTVESHRRNLFQKLGVKNSVGLTKAAVRLGVI